MFNFNLYQKISLTSMLLFSIPSMSQQNVNSNIKVSAKALSGCTLQSHDVHFNFTGQETQKISDYHPWNLPIFENTEDLDLKVQCSKGINIGISVSIPYSGTNVFKLKHNTVAGAPTPTYWFVFKNSTSGLTKANTMSYQSRLSTSMIMPFKVSSSEQQTMFFSTEVDFANIKNYVPGDYSDNLTLNLTY